MRQLAIHPNKAELQTFSSFLFAQGIETEFEPTENGEFVLWVLDDDHVPYALQNWKAFLANPQDQQFLKGAEQGEKKFEEAKKGVQKSRAKVISGRSTFGRSQNQNDQAFITLGLIIISFGLFAFTVYGDDASSLRALLFISNDPQSRGLPEVLSGQVWRLITPIFMHGSFIHLFFNVSILWNLGSVIESRLGSLPFAAVVFVSAILSNLGQYVFEGPFFLGLSGVVFGLIGFAAYIQKRNPWENLGLDSFLLWLALAWMVLGFLLSGSGLLLVGNMANYAHLFGFLGGLGMAFFFQHGIQFFARPDR